MKFGVVPLPLLRWPNPMDYVELFVPPDLMPPPSDTLRHTAIREVFGFEMERAQGFVLQTADLAQMRRRREPEAVASLRQFVTLLVTDEQMVRTFVETRGRLRGTVDSAALGEAFARFLDFNLGRLPPGTPAQAGVPGLPGLPEELWATDISLCLCAMQHEALQAWHALFSERYPHRRPPPPPSRRRWPRESRS